MELATLLVLGFTAISAAAAAVASLKTAKAARRAAEVARVSALLTTVPLLVPWTPGKTGQIQVVNRGGTASHNLRWRVMIGDIDVADGDDQRVIIPVRESNVARDLDLSDGQRAQIIAWSANKRPTPMTVECRYLASWGQAFTTTRTYPAGSTGSVIVITDDQGTPLRLDPDDS
jgi:hypothetical protein